MKNSIIRLTFTTPLGSAAHRQAEKFRRSHSNPQKAKQVYLNTLAVYAVNFYLQGLGFETLLETSDSSDPIMQALANIADLDVKNIGKLECRPVMPNASAVEIPAEVWSDRIGYIAVQFNQSLTEATLLGFVKAVETEELPLSEWRSLDDLLDYLEQLSQAPAIELNEWFHKIFKAGWQSLEEIVETIKMQEMNLAYGFGGSDRHRDNSATIPRAIPALVELLHNSHDRVTRLQVIDLLGNIAPGNPDAIAAIASVMHATPDKELRRQAAVNLGKIDPGNAKAGARGAKVIDLGMRLDGRQVVLVVTLLPEDNRKINVHLRVYPTGGQMYLPPNLKLEVLDELGESLLKAESRNADNAIQLELRGDRGDEFGVRLTLAETSIMESFIV